MDRVAGHAVERVQTGHGQCGLVAEGDDDAHRRGADHPTAEVVGAGEGALLHGALDAAARHGVLEHRPARQVGPGLGVGVARRRAGDDTPVVEHLRDVEDPPGLFGGPQHDVVVLAAVERRPESPDARQQLVTYDRHVAQVRVRQEEVGVPVGFEVGLERAAELVELVLVRVQDVDVVVRRDRRGDLGQRVGLQDVVVVQEHHVLPRGQGQGPVGGRRDAPVRIERRHLDPGVGGGEGRQLVGQVGVPRAVVAETELPVLVALVEDGAHALPEVPEGRPVDGDDDAEQRPVDGQPVARLRLGVLGAVLVPQVDPVPVLGWERGGVVPPHQLAAGATARLRQLLDEPVGEPRHDLGQPAGVVLLRPLLFGAHRWDTGPWRTPPWVLLRRSGTDTGVSVGSPSGPNRRVTLRSAVTVASIVPLRVLAVTTPGRSVDDLPVAGTVGAVGRPEGSTPARS